MNYKFGVYGDSIVFGYGNNNQSWFDILFPKLTSIDVKIIDVKTLKKEWIHLEKN